MQMTRPRDGRGAGLSAGLDHDEVRRLPPGVETDRAESRGDLDERAHCPREDTHEGSEPGRASEGSRIDPRVAARRVGEPDVAGTRGRATRVARRSRRTLRLLVD